MNVREAKNFGLNNLNFENIRENQRKVVEAYLSSRDEKAVQTKFACLSVYMQITCSVLVTLFDKCSVVLGERH